MAGEVTLGRMLTLSEVCLVLGVTRRTGYDLLSRGKFPLTPVRVGKGYRFSPTEVERLVNGLDHLDQAVQGGAQ